MCLIQPIVFTQELDYIESKCTAAERIAAIENLIDALFASALKAVTKSDIQEYTFNDGQTVIKKMYRNPQQVMDTIALLENLKRRYIYKINGGQQRLVDNKVIAGWNMNNWGV